MTLGRRTPPLLRTELDLAYLAWVHRPGEHLSVLDNAGDLAACMERVGANATTVGAMIRPKWDPARGAFAADIDAERVQAQADLVRDRGAWCAAYLGDFNNPWFLEYPADFVERLPDAWMRDPKGARVELARDARGRAVVIPVTALDDPVIWELATGVIRRAGAILRATGRVVQWIAGTEQSFPELFGLPDADYRPASLRHFDAWLRRENRAGAIPVARLRDLSDEEAQAAWFSFREAAMADRAAHYAAAFLETGPDVPIFYPTHNSMFCRTVRRRLGQPAADMAGATDGLELGHITIDDDDERLNPLVNAHFSSFGKPVIAPRLANKTLDPSIVGGGRSFTPPMLRRLVYESLGHGLWHIGPIHWTSVLHDGDWHIKGTPAEAACCEVFAEIKAAAPVLDGMARLQPQVGLYVSDDTWRKGWDPRWTMLFQDSLAAHWNLAVVSDASLGAPLAARMPVLLSLDNDRISAAARLSLADYCAAGGELLAVGALAERDERARAVPWTAAPGRVCRLGPPPASALRKLTLETHNGEGAFAVEEQAAPVNLAWLEAAALTWAPDAVLRPVTVSPDPPAGSINVFVLTDRCSVAVVAVNLADSPADGELRLAPPLASVNERWRCTDALSREVLSDSFAARVKLDARGTRIVWFHPRGEDSQLEETAARAGEALGRWDAQGFDTRFLEAARRALSGQSALPAKTFAFARTVDSSIALRVRAGWTADGSLEVAADALDAAGKPPDSASVTMTLAPGTCTPVPLETKGGGRFSLMVPRNRLPLRYDAESCRYDPSRGPLRVVLSVSESDGRAGGAMIVVPRRGAR